MQIRVLKLQRGKCNPHGNHKEIAIEYKFLKWGKILSILQQKVKHNISNIGNEQIFLLFGF